MPERVRERDLVIPALRAAANNGGEITMTQLIEELTEEFEPSGVDAEILEGRNDSHFSQKVRNLVSHRETGTSMFTKGYAEYHAPSESIRITDAGAAFLGHVPE
jgi:hypothetical protein